MMETIAVCLRDNPEAALALAGVIAAVVVQVYKRLFRLLPGQDALEKRVAAVVASLIAVVSEQAIAHEWHLGRMLAAVLVAWLVSAGTHSVALSSSDVARAAAKNEGRM